MDVVHKAKARMLFSQPFFAAMLLSTPLIEDRSIPTAATDMKVIRYNPDFFASMTVGQVMFVLAHEVLHIAFMHGLRRQHRQHRAWNIAADFAINLVLVDAGMETPPIQICLDRKYVGMSAEAIYDSFPKSGEQGRGRKPGEDEIDGLGEDLQEPGDGDGLTAEEAEGVKREIEQKVAAAASMARLAGKLSGDLERLVKEMLNPAVPWEELLRDYMTRVTQDDESWQRRNRRFRDIYLPARHTTRLGEIVVIGDTSGSITEKELDQVAAEVRTISDNMTPERIRMLWADTCVKKEECFEPGDPLAFGPVGGGGTDMRVPLAYAEQYEPQVVVLITDGHTPWPQTEPPYPLIVVCTTKADVPIGSCVRISV